MNQFIPFAESSGRAFHPHPPAFPLLVWMSNVYFHSGPLKSSTPDFAPYAQGSCRVFPTVTSLNVQLFLPPDFSQSRVRSEGKICHLILWIYISYYYNPPSPKLCEHWRIALFLSWKLRKNPSCLKLYGVCCGGAHVLSLLKRGKHGCLHTCLCVRSVLCFISVLIVHHNRVKEHYFIMIYARF